MICYRLLCHAKTAKEYLGDEYASPYFTIITLLVESALPYTLSAIAFLVSYGSGSQTAIAFSRVYALMMVRVGALFRASTTSGADRFVVCIATDVDLACGRRNGMAERVDHSATIGGQVLSELGNYVGRGTWGQGRAGIRRCEFGVSRESLKYWSKRVNLVIT